MKNKKIFFCLLITFLFFLPVNSFSKPVLDIISPNYFNEQDNIYKPIHYINGEILSFRFCDDNNKYELNNLSIYLKDQSGKGINLSYLQIPGKKNCYFLNYKFNGSNFNFNDFYLIIKYELNGIKKEIQREFMEQKESKLINFIISKNSTDPLTLVSKLIVYNNLYGKSSEISKDYYNLLKENRDNSKKCWPKYDCDILETARILTYLKFGGYDKDNRLISDGIYYINDNIISNENNKRDINIILEKDSDELGNGTLFCKVKYDDEEKEYELDKDDFDNNKYEISLSIYNNVDVTCNLTMDKIKIEVYSIDKESKESFYDRDINTLNHNIEPYACIINDDGECDFKNTLYSLIAVGDYLDDKDLLISYIKSFLNEEDNLKFIDYNNKYLYTSLYLLLEKDDKVIDYLKYKENNDGSWGFGTKYSKILHTAWAVISLSDTNIPKEYIEDAEKWIYYSEPTLGWSDIEKNLVAYLAIKKNLKPYLVINNISKINNFAILNIKNPTIYNINNLKLYLGDLKEYLSYEENLESLENEENISVKLMLKNNLQESKFGYLKIIGSTFNNKNMNLITLPILLEPKKPYSLKNNISYFKDSNELILKFENNTNETGAWECYLEFNNLKFMFNLNNNNYNNIRIKSKESLNLKNKTNVKITCSNNKRVFTENKIVNIKIINKKFDANPNELVISKIENFNINVKNLLDKKIILEIDVDGLNIIKPIEDFKVIAKNDRRDIFFNVSTNNLENYNGKEGKIILKTDDYIKEIPIKILVKKEGKKRNQKLITSLKIIGIIILIFIVFRILGDIYLRRKEEEEEDLENNDEDIYIDELV